MPNLLIPLHPSTRVKDKCTRPYFDDGTSLLDRSIRLANKLGQIPYLVCPEGYTPTWGEQGAALLLQLPPGAILDHLKGAAAILGDHCCLLQCTSPYVKLVTIERCLNVYDGYDTVFTSHPQKPATAYGPPPVDGLSRADPVLPGFYHEPYQQLGLLNYYWDGACLCYNAACSLENNGTLFTPSCNVVETTQLEAWQVDEEVDVLGGQDND